MDLFQAEEHLGCGLSSVLDKEVYFDQKIYILLGFTKSEEDGDTYAYACIRQADSVIVKQVHPSRIVLTIDNS